MKLNPDKTEMPSVRRSSSVLGRGGCTQRPVGVVTLAPKPFVRRFGPNPWIRLESASQCAESSCGKQGVRISRFGWCDSCIPSCI